MTVYSSVYPDEIVDSSHGHGAYPKDVNHQGDATAWTFGDTLGLSVAHHQWKC
jgi:hypothetical protein